MMRLLVVVSIVAGLVLAGAGPALAFIPGQSTLIIASKGLSDVFEIKKKWKFKKWKKRPPGWDRGRKVGWRGGKVPPGQRYR